MRLLFAGTLFVGAALLFLVQPLLARMVLPLLGGAPAVWNTCMVFFQAALLAGYAYAHAAPAWLGVRRHAVIHLLLLTAVLGLVPLLVCCRCTCRTAGRNPDDFHPILWLIALLLASAGLPFAVVSTTQPAAATLVHAHRRPGRARSVFPLRRQQPRQHPRAAGVPVPAGTDAVAGASGLAVGGGVRPPDRADRGVRRVLVAGAGRSEPRP